MTEYDSPWKEILDAFFREFIEFAFPELYAAIDWSKSIVTLDKELQQIAPVSEVGTRHVDKLVEVVMLDGQIRWLLVHVEVQTHWEGNFAARMFVYFYRIRDKYNKPLVSIAVLGDSNRNWRQSKFSEDMFGCRVDFQFPIVKLLDYASDIDGLERSENVFATVVLAHLMTLQTASAPVERQRWKLRLMRLLYERGKSAQEIRQMFRVIDWMMDLPPALELQFRSELELIEEENKMPYITSVERLAKNEGLQEGRIEGRVEGRVAGIESGIVIGQIILLQKLHRVPQTGREVLETKTLEELNEILAKLEKPRVIES